ncbi:hypothetical protein SAMN05216174_12714 [Actinokineospora iranica]|uniref:DUF397 domain-containing protein n=1 Tax=Actinokineospora iranica TaxID=1271860 RepID=A0A1G6Z9K5_9PSEU|nr:hypothetical protein SAMN05216174_12714 [Actinokineospora iranica]
MRSADSTRVVWRKSSRGRGSEAVLFFAAEHWAAFVRGM